jgi:hypothetical protein
MNYSVNDNNGKTLHVIEKKKCGHPPMSAHFYPRCGAFKNIRKQGKQEKTLLFSFVRFGFLMFL